MSDDRRGRLLLVDDSEIVLELLGGMLELDGWDVCTAEGPASALGSMAAFAPDVVVTDLEMPGVSLDRLPELVESFRGLTGGGSNAGGRARSSGAVLLYSARPAAELRELADRAGADGYVVKSSDFEAVLSAVKPFR